MEVLHLMVNNTCTNKCPLCCNKQYDVDKIPIVTVEDLKSVDTICITGGEPFLSDQLVPFLYSLISSYPNIEIIYIYTSGGSVHIDEVRQLIDMQHMYDIEIGLSLGPKSGSDRNRLRFGGLDEIISNLGNCRFYCFTKEDLEIANVYYDQPNVEIIERKWQKEFKPAENTIFRRLPVWLL